MLGDFLVASLLLAGQPQPPPPPTTPAQVTRTDLALEIAAGRYASDHRKTGSAGSSGPGPFSTTIYTTETCAVLGAESEPDGAPSRVKASIRPHTMWQVSSKVVDRTAFGLAVAIDWRRVTDSGKSIENGPSGSLQVTIRSGERLLLDTVSCPDAAAIRLEASVVAHADRATVTTGSVTSAGGRGANAGGGMGVGRPAASTPRGGGGGAGVASAGRGRGAGGGAAGRPGGGGAGAQGQMDEVFRTRNARRLNAELWLVHGVPGREEAVQRVAVQTAGPTNFGFPAVALSTADGASVEVNGQIQLVPETATVNGQTVPDSARRLSVFIQRRLWTTQNPRGTAWSTTKTIDMPAASDVVEFELPPLEGDAYKGHKFSVRLRLQ
jgi:hypothetical protein